MRRIMDKSPETPFENVNSGEPRVLIPPGEYPGNLLRWEEAQTPWGEKLYAYYEVFLLADNKKSVHLRRHYKVDRDTTGAWFCGDGHDYRKDWIRANRGRLPIPRKRLPIGKFGESMMVLAIETVMRDGRRPLHPSSYYSKVGFVVRPLEEGEVLLRCPV